VSVKDLCNPRKCWFHQIGSCCQSSNNRLAVRNPVSGCSVRAATIPGICSVSQGTICCLRHSLKTSPHELTNRQNFAPGLDDRRSNAGTSWRARFARYSGKCSALNPLIPSTSDRSHFLTVRRSLTDLHYQGMRQGSAKPQCLREACTGLSRRPPLVVQVVMVLRFPAVVTCLRRETTLPECPLGRGMCIFGMERNFCAQVLRSDEH
jgi:hypothetical protein